MFNHTTKNSQLIIIHHQIKVIAVISINRQMKFIAVVIVIIVNRRSKFITVIIRANNCWSNQVQ